MAIISNQDNKPNNSGNGLNTIKEAGGIFIKLKPVLLTLGAVVVTGGLVWGGISIYNYYKNQSPTALFSSEVDIDPNAGYYVKDDTQKGEPITGVAIPGFSEATIPAGITNVSMMFMNPEVNANKYYLQFTLVLKDTGETLYSSKMVPPGQCIQNITLSRALTAGNYPAIVKVQPYRMDTLKETNNADMVTTLIVK